MGNQEKGGRKEKESKIEGGYIPESKIPDIGRWTPEKLETVRTNAVAEMAKLGKIIEAVDDERAKRGLI